VPSDIDEAPLPGETPAALVRRLARAKALEGRSRHDSTRPVLGADTVVVLDGQVFGKPRDRDDALRMLMALGGHEHQVLTAVAVVAAARSPVLEALSVSSVKMRLISAPEAGAYWDSGEPAGKAGAYAIQGLGAMFIEHIAGSYSGVMGLPLYETARLLQAVQPPPRSTG
jgi:septum formation protein